MKAWFERIMWKLSGWMQGRYGHKGQDRLSKHLIILSVIFLILSLFVPVGILSSLAIFNLIYSIFRSFSKNIDARKKELELYEKLLNWPKGFVKLQKLRLKDGKTHKYFRCECGAILRVPKGRGKIEVTCPKCKLHTIRKT